MSADAGPTSRRVKGKKPGPVEERVLEAAAMVRFWAGWGAVNGFLGVGAGAFGAHALRGKLEPAMLEAFETGVRYQLFHALALLALAALTSAGVRTSVTGWAFVAGTALFSGSLYLLALTGVRQLGAVTPLGGLSLLAGWALLALRCLRP